MGTRRRRGSLLLAPGTEIVLPTHLVSDETVVLDLGGVGVKLFTLGRGHSSGDLMIGAPGVLPPWAKLIR